MDPKSSSKSGPKTNDSMFRKICKNMKLVKLKSSAVAPSPPVQADAPSAPAQVDALLDIGASIVMTMSTNEKEEDHYDFNDFQYDWQYRKMTTKDMESFVDQLAKFNRYIQSIKELTNMTYHYPHALQNKLEQNSNELESFYGEARAALENIQRIQLQRKAVKKEIGAAKVTLKKIKDDEAREMESVVHAYDKVLFARWENLKVTHKPELLENFKNDVKNKQIALDNLQTLISRRLSNLTVLTPMSDKPATTSTKSPDRVTATARRHTSTYGANATGTHLGMSAHRPTSRRHRQTENTASARGTLPTIFGGNTPPVYGPHLDASTAGNMFGGLAFGGSAFGGSAFGGSAFGGPVVVGPTTPRFRFNPPAPRQSASLASTSSTTLVPTAATRMGRNNAANMALATSGANGNEFSSEMQGVLNALFGELRHTDSDSDSPAAMFQTSAADSGTSSVTEDDSMDMDLYSVD